MVYRLSVALFRATLFSRLPFGLPLGEGFFRAKGRVDGLVGPRGRRETVQGHGGKFLPKENTSFAAAAN